MPWAKDMKQWPVLLLGALLAGAAGGAELAGEDDGLEALLKREVEGPSRYAQSLLDAPAAVSVIGRRESELLGHSTVAEMMGRLPGVYFSHSRQYISVGMRGFNRPGDYNARLLMAIDGFRANDALFDQALPEYEFPLVAEWVKRLELVHGPSASVYGGNALLGVVNLVTMDGADAPGLRLKGSAGSFGTRRAMAQYGSSDLGGGDLFVGLNLLRSDGEDLVLPELGLPGGKVRGLDGTRYATLFAKYRLGGWRASLSAMQRDKDVATAPYGAVPGAAGTAFGDRFAHAELAYDEGWREEFRHSLRLGVARSSFAGDYVFEDGLINRDRSRAHWASLEARLQWRGWINHDLMLGLDARLVPEGRQRNFDEQPFVSYLDSRESSRSLGLYAQDQWRLSQAWQLTAGLRLDAIKDHRPEWSPRLALVYRGRPDESIKLLLGRAFRAPNLAERFYSDGGVSQQANPDLAPERLSTLELAWERSLDAQTVFTLNAYRTRMSAMIELVPIGDAGVGRYENLSRVSTRGLDLGLERRLRADWQWRINLSLMDADSAGQGLSNSPRWLLKGHLIMPLAASWSLGLEAQGMGSREGRVRVPGHVTGNALLRFAGWRSQVLGLRVKNLADVRYDDPAGPDNEALLRVPQARRSIQLDWQLSF